VTQNDIVPTRVQVLNVVTKAVGRGYRRPEFGRWWTRSPTRSKKVFTRHRAQIRAASGVYGAQYQGDEGFRRVQREIEGFAREEGRRPRMLVAKLGQDGHDRGAKIIATAFADIGFDVDIGPLFQTPEEAAGQAVENDIHIVGVSTHAAGHKTLVPALVEALKREGAADILVVCGGVVPPKDYDFLKKAGVSAIYGPGTNIPKAAAEILSLIRTHRLAVTKQHLSY
jgi:methylmalonyl-CoA mutase